MKKNQLNYFEKANHLDWLIHQLQTYCLSRRMKYSERRLIIAFKLAEINRKVEAEELWILLKKDGYTISIASVYLNLSVLVDAGVCISERLTQRQALYALRATA
ncbi:transcriptional repressor [Sphingobacterium sp. LRF_L2]|uniref:transcriptional repressor n=1 Tax=Sphingobacterium sp. LRF_L2 TaxID=3369421 RepID=UPI003F5D6CE8